MACFFLGATLFLISSLSTMLLNSMSMRGNPSLSMGNKNSPSRRTAGKVVYEMTT